MRVATLNGDNIATVHTVVMDMNLDRGGRDSETKGCVKTPNIKHINTESFGSGRDGTGDGRGGVCYN